VGAARFSWKQTYPLRLRPADDGSLAPQYVIERIGKIAGPDAVYVAGVGQHQMWAAQFIDYEKPRTWINSGGLGTMGFAVPAAMGAKVGRPDATGGAIDGDGCFQMTNQELATCAIEGIPIKVAIINNGSLGMVRQWQTLFYNERYSNTDLGTGTEADGGTRIPTSSSWPRPTAASGCAASEPSDVDAVIEQAMAINDRPVVVDFIVHKDAMVWPMVAAGTQRRHQVRARPGARLGRGDEHGRRNRRQPRRVT
jgi:acetolactate synthase-1/2/3 large subunit